LLFFVKNNFNKKTGVLIINGGKNVPFILGAGKDIGIGSDLFWCDRWFIYRKKFIYNFRDKKKKFTLKLPGLEVVKKEHTSVVVYWDSRRCKTYIKDI